MGIDRFERPGADCLFASCLRNAPSTTVLDVETIAAFVDRLNTAGTGILRGELGLDMRVLFPVGPNAE